MPLLTRMIGTPLAIDIAPGAVQRLAPLLADRRISSGGHVAVVTGPGLGEEVAAICRPQLANAEFLTVEGGSVESARALADDLRKGFHDALVAIGGGRTLDVAKLAAALTGLPIVTVATSLAHDGLASPVASLVQESVGGKGSYGVQMPIAIVVDLDFVRRSDPRMRRAGVGDAISNLSAIADWQLAERERGEEVDGVAVTFARTAATAVLHRDDGIDDADFLVALAEALVLSGLAMSTAGSSRPCSGGEHEVLHAIDALFPGTANHGELAGVATLYTSFLRDDIPMLSDVDACLKRHELPRTPADIGLTDEQFAEAVHHAPATRPDRFTILEHLALDVPGARHSVAAFVEAVGG